ncbi:MAG TPA: glutathione S-transferase family protein [Steroidobacteraceae bacterium]|nr:glutathione S-transferase family protein [Steroidobacteraceae bacterium]
MTAEIVFYTDPMSRGRIVHWMLEESGAPHRIEPISLQRNEQKKPAYLAINPMGKVPAIVHNGTVVTECAAICTYLADAFPAAGLAPDIKSPQRGTYLRWMFFGAGCVDPALMDTMLARPPVERPQALSYGTRADMTATLEKALQPGPYILGERFSAADVYIGSQIGFGFMMKALEPRPILVKYHERLAQRDAFKRASEKSDQLSAQMKG